MPTKISYLDEQWSPIAMRCTRVSPGCAHCWHIPFARRHSKNPTFSDEAQFGYSGQGPVLIDERLQIPLRWKKPRRIGVQFMGDLFHPAVSDSMRDRVWSVMSQSRQHTFLLLTKRSDEMQLYFSKADRFKEIPGTWSFPLPNVWMGVSVENQEKADERIPLLLNTHSARRWVSVEPMLGPIGLNLYISDDAFRVTDDLMDAPDGARLGRFERVGDWWKPRLPRVDWVVCGGESGPKARPMDGAWPRSLRDQCAVAGVPFYFKQWSGLLGQGNTILDGREHLEVPACV